MTFPTRHVVLGILLQVTKLCPIHASPYQEIERTLQCKSFHAVAKTVISMAKDAPDSARSQDVWIIDEKSQLSRHINLYQHRSPDVQHHNAAALDALAYEWRCFHARSGLDYLFVDFGCQNDSARTCSTAMGLSGGEWSAIYDFYGTTVLYATTDGPKQTNGACAPLAF